MALRCTSGTNIDLVTNYFGTPKGAVLKGVSPNLGAPKGFLALAQRGKGLHEIQW